MNGSRSRATWFVVLALGAAGLAVLAAISELHANAEAALALAAAAATACAAVAALAAARFRDSRDPHALYVSVAFLTLTLQRVVFGIWWPLSHSSALSVGWTSYAPPVPSIRTWGGTAPSYALQAGWTVAAALLLLALPWSDRRGRPPVRASRVVLVALGTIVVVDLLFAALFRDVTHGESAGILGWLMATGAVVLLIVAAWREWHTRRAGGPYLSVALLLAVVYQVALLANFPAGYPAYQWADALMPLIPVIVFAGLLMEQRGEASRMRRATDRAQEVMGGRAEIASMIAHEVRGPVSTVRGIASTSLTHFDRLSDDERREFLEMIEQESGRLMATVDQMSLALKVDAGTLSYQPRPLALSEVVRAGVIAADVTDHPVEVDVQDELSVVADDRRLQEVVRQLVSNAARYSPEGAPIHVSVHHETGAHGDRAVIDVSDAGPGIPDDLRERVFEKFPNWRPMGYQDQPGTGLGLFICRGIVTEHGGDIRVVEGSGGGTMLRVRVPVER